MWDYSLSMNIQIEEVPKWGDKFVSYSSGHVNIHEAIHAMIYSIHLK